MKLCKSVYPNSCHNLNAAVTIAINIFSSSRKLHDVDGDADLHLNNRQTIKSKWKFFSCFSSCNTCYSAWQQQIYLTNCVSCCLRNVHTAFLYWIIFRKQKNIHIFWLSPSPQETLDVCLTAFVQLIQFLFIAEACVMYKFCLCFDCFCFIFFFFFINSTHKSVHICKHQAVWLGEWMNSVFFL